MERIINDVIQRNKTVAAHINSTKTLGEWLNDERGKLAANRRLSAPKSKEDLISICCGYILRFASEEEADRAGEALAVGMMHTADHLGGLYSPQSFQGDLLFARMLKKEEPTISSVPIFSFGIVPLSSSTYARGIMTFTRSQDIERVPIFPKNPTNAVASLVDGFDAQMVRRAKDRGIGSICSFLVKKELRRLTDELYLREDVLSCKRYADQIHLLSKGIYDRISRTTGQAGICHMEAEEVFGALFLRDFAEKDGFLYTLLSDPANIRVLNEVHDAENKPLSTLFFRGGDEARRCFPLNLCEDGFLRGTTTTGHEVSLRFTPSDIKDALLRRQIFTDVFLSWILSSFLRGFTWYGGIFQSLYLPGWHERFITALKRMGFTAEAEAKAAMECSGYISGPCYMLFDNGDGATLAGPLEMLAKRPDAEHFGRLMENTKVSDAHLMGMFEFYNDLVWPAERVDNWYEIIAKYQKEHFPENYLQNQ